MAMILRNRLDDMRLAMMVLTRLPMGTAALSPDATLGRALWAYPLAGALVGGLSGGAFWLADLAGLPRPLAATFALVASALLTGCLHEDGLADFVDGIGGGRTRERKLEIMRDSRIGTYGTVALVLSLILRWSAVDTLGTPENILLVWIAAGAVSRGGIAVPLALLPPARSDGLGAQAARPPSWSYIGAGLLAIGVAAAALRLHALPLIAIVLLASSIVTALAWRHLRGQTGDVLGACALAGECAGLAVATAGWF